MKQLRRAGVAGILAGLAVLSMPAAALDAGAPAPDFSLPGLAQAVNLAALKGKVVYVDFWASWCGPCRQSFPFMNDLQSRYRAQGLEVLAVNLDAKREDADRFLGQFPASFTVAFDAKGESAKRFEVKGMPSSVLIGRDGRIVAAHKGFREEDRQELEARIARALEAH
jgi:thiol-disulfide isomerase/thioredoxin